MKRAALAAVALWGAALAAGCRPAAPGPAAPPPLIERAALFGNPERTQARLSPDGAWVSFLAPVDGYLNIFVAPSSDIGKARQLTRERARGIKKHFWAETSAHVLYVQDSAGDENWVIHAVDVTDGADRALTPTAGVNAMFLGSSPRKPDEVIVALNDRDPAWHDVYAVDVRSGARKSMLKNDRGFANFVLDENNTVRLAASSAPDGSVAYWSPGVQGAWSKLFTVPFEDAVNTYPLAFSDDGASFLMLSSIGLDKTALARVDTATGVQTVIGESRKADVSDVWLDPATNAPEAYAAQYLKLEWTALTDEASADITFLEAELKGEFDIVSRSADDAKWIVVEDGPTVPTRSYLYDRKARTLVKLFNQRPALEGAPLQPMIPLEIAARDGLTLVSYLTLPPGADSDGDGRPERPAPLVLAVHGGPWDRDVYGLSPEHQWLANRGYTVLSVNFRGSTGFGKAFVNRGNKEWGGKMQADLIDAVEWALREGIATPDKVAIYGGSYGGYAALAGLAFTPDVFACGVDIVGPSNLESMLQATPAYWKHAAEDLALRVGDVRTEEGRALLKERSPLHKAGAIKKPLLIAQGANDPRVKRAESDQIVSVMQAAGLPVTYLLFPDEGHGLGRPQNRMAFYAAAEAFLAGCLGGRTQSVGKDAEGSSVQVLAGGDFVPTLPRGSKAR